MEPSPAQQEVITRVDGPTLVIAPPGSGKTHTLTERIYYLISRKNISAEKILALTFTTKAAQEIAERIKRRLGDATSLPYSATFHALALDMLRTHADAIGIQKDFSVVATTEEKQEDANVLTFDELLTHALRLLEDVPDARTYWQNKFSHILVDEYQDTNDVQDEIAAILARGHRNLCVIGDPDQAIYGFRGANLENFLQFEKRYPDARRLHLDRNYRSRPSLIKAAHALISCNEKRIVSACPQAHCADSEAKITVAKFFQPRDEARYIVRTVAGLIGGTYHADIASSGAVKEYDGVYQPGDIAVLYRLNVLGKALGEAFDQQGIPYVLVTEANINEITFEIFTVTLLTMHAAKGLEFPVVFVAGLEDGVTPYVKYDTNGSGEPENDIEEERRLFYVAMTRAKERLFLTHSSERMLFGRKFQMPSRFLSELPQEYVAIEEMQKKQKPIQRRLF